MDVEKALREQDEELRTDERKGIASIYLTFEERTDDLSSLRDLRDQINGIIIHAEDLAMLGWDEPEFAGTDGGWTDYRMCKSTTVADAWSEHQAICPERVLAFCYDETDETEYLT